MLIRRERAGDEAAIGAVHHAAFLALTEPGGEPVEPGLVDALRADDGWLPNLSLVAEGDDGSIVGHVVCTRGWIGAAPALGLGPLGVRPDHQRQGVGQALMHAVLGAADATDEPVVVLLGHPDYYPRFGFRLAAELGIEPPEADWAPHFQARALATHDPTRQGVFTYAAPFAAL